MSTYIIYPEYLSKNIPELTTLREQWAAIYTSHEIIKKDYNKKAEIIHNTIKIAQDELRKSIKYIYTLTTREYKIDRYNSNHDSPKKSLFIIKREVDINTVPEILRGDKRLLEEGYSYPFDILNDVIIPFDYGGLYNIVKPKILLPSQHSRILQLEIPEGVFDLPNRSN